MSPPWPRAKLLAPSPPVLLSRLPNETQVSADNCQLQEKGSNKQQKPTTTTSLLRQSTLQTLAVVGVGEKSSRRGLHQGGTFRAAIKKEKKKKKKKDSGARPRLGSHVDRPASSQNI